MRVKGGRAGNYPKTGSLRKLADSYRPAERERFESEPVNLGPAPEPRNWFTLVEVRDVTERYHAEAGAEHADNRERHRRGLISGSDLSGKKKLKSGWTYK